jgi:hypothetical protein
MMEQMPMHPAAMIAALDVDSPPPLSISCGCKQAKWTSRAVHGCRQSWQCWPQQQQDRNADGFRRCMPWTMYQGR